MISSFNIIYIYLLDRFTLILTNISPQFYPTIVNLTVIFIMDCFFCFVLCIVIYILKIGDSFFFCVLTFFHTIMSMIKEAQLIQLFQCDGGKYMINTEIYGQHSPLFCLLLARSTLERRIHLLIINIRCFEFVLMIIF